MAATNSPETPFFNQLVNLEGEIADRRIDIQAVYDSAKENSAIGKAGIKVLRKAVRRYMEDEKKRQAREVLEGAADDLLHRLGHLRGTPLGDATERAAAE